MLSHLLPPFRGERDLQINKMFLIGPHAKIILDNLQYGFREDWAHIMPPTNSIPCNFLKSREAVQKARERFMGEIRKGRMLGGFGSSGPYKKVKDFLSGRCMSSLVGPCQKTMTPVAE